MQWPYMGRRRIWGPVANRVIAKLLSRPGSMQRVHRRSYDEGVASRLSLVRCVCIKNLIVLWRAGFEARHAGRMRTSERQAACDSGGGVVTDAAFGLLLPCVCTATTCDTCQGVLASLSPRPSFSSGALRTVSHRAMRMRRGLSVSSAAHSARVCQCVCVRVFVCVCVG